jgi:hypothetical protein
MHDARQIRLRLDLTHDLLAFDDGHVRRLELGVNDSLEVVGDDVIAHHDFATVELNVGRLHL